MLRTGRPCMSPNSMYSEKFVHTNVKIDNEGKIHHNWYIITVSLCSQYKSKQKGTCSYHRVLILFGCLNHKTLG